MHIIKLLCSALINICLSFHSVKMLNSILLCNLQKPEDSLELQTRELVMSNVSTLPLTTGLKLEKPFQILLDDNTEVSETVSIVSYRPGN